MGKELSEGLLLDLLEKRRAGKFTGDELLWAADHPECIRWLRAHPKVAESIRRGVCTGELSAPVDPIIRVVVDYSLSLAKMIAAGKYDWADGDITPKRFPMKGEGKVERELVLVYLYKVVTTDEVLVELDRCGLRPAKIEELLALGATCPELQKEFPIVAGGSHWVRPDSRRVFACLRWLGPNRRLDLRGGDSGWEPFCRFLAVRKDAK